MLKTLFKISTKNLIARKSSIVIVLFIAFAVALLTVTNAIFDSTENGVKETFTSSFTGDVVIRPKYDIQLSLFGDETPITGEFTSTPTLESINVIEEKLNSISDIKCFTNQLSGRTIMEFFNENGVVREPIFLFGIDFKSYLNVMDSIDIIEGNIPEDTEKTIMISDILANHFGCKVGDTIQFTIADGFSFRIRAVKIVAIYHYPEISDDSILSKIALIDDKTFRNLMNVQETISRKEKSNLNEVSEEVIDEDFSEIDDLFSEAEDFSIENSSANIVIENNEIVEEYIQNDDLWNFIVIRLNDSSKAKKIISSMNKFLSKNDIYAEAVGWRVAAGNTALYIYILRLILNIGILIILTAGLIVVNNTLVVNVLDRTTEIGTMRAIGASKFYIRMECFAETITLAFTSGVIGIIIGTIFSKIINTMQITFTNKFLVQLFGSGSLVTAITFETLFGSFMFAIFLGAIAWVNPSNSVLKINLVKAMQTSK